jgi:hypothetical protein
MQSFLTVLRGYETRDHLARLAQPVPSAAHGLAAWLTGQSSYRHSQLSPAQRAVLDELEGLGFATVGAGFPYNARALEVPYRREPLVRASLRNAGQCAAALASPAFAAEVARHLQPLVDAAGRRLLLLCGSCGLQLLAAALHRLDLPAGLRLGLVGVGPVCFAPAAVFAARPQVDLVIVQGSRDWISRLGSRARPDLRPPLRHLEYLVHPAGRAALRQAVLTLAER